MAYRVYEIYDGSSLVNTIVSDESFVSSYCSKNGYTYKYKQQEDALPEPTAEERIAILEKESNLLIQQIGVLSDRNDFLEDCIAEMAGVVYG